MRRVMIVWLALAGMSGVAAGAKLFAPTWLATLAGPLYAVGLGTPLWFARLFSRPFQYSCGDATCHTNGYFLVIIAAVVVWWTMLAMAVDILYTLYVTVRRKPTSSGPTIV